MGSAYACPIGFVKKSMKSMKINGISICWSHWFCGDWRDYL